MHTNDVLMSFAAFQLTFKESVIAHVLYFLSIRYQLYF